MSELLQAAKAVIKRFNDWDCVHIDNLRAAVERAEKQEAATDFCKWWHSNGFGNYGIHHAQMAWAAAQQAERERCAILCERLPYGSGLAGKTYAEALRGVGHGGELAAGTNTNLEKIDAL